MSVHRTLVSLVGCALMSILGAGVLTGQVSVFPVQDLSFGPLRPGIGERVATDDAQRRAELNILGSGRLTLTLSLPAELVSTTGRLIPLTFTARDAEVVYRTSGKAHSFNPTKAVELKVPDAEGGLSIHLGGLAAPGPTTPPGSYTAKVTVMVAAAGT